MKNTSPTPPPSPITFGFYANNEIKNMYYRLADPSWQVVWERVKHIVPVYNAHTYQVKNLGKILHII
jgi:hypothetical protein